MGIIDKAAKVGIAKDKIKSGVVETYEKFADAAAHPITSLRDDYAEAKAKALKDEREGKKNADKDSKNTSSIVGALRNAGRAVGGRGDSGSSGGSDEGGILLLFWISLFTHFIDAMTNFQRPGYMIYVYVLIIIFAFFFVFKMHVGGSDEMTLLVVVILAYMLPYLPKMFPDNRWVLALSGIIFLFPILTLYIGLKFGENSFVNRASKWYIVFWMIVLVFYVITTMSPSQNTKALINNPVAGVKFVITGTGNTITKSMLTFNDAVKRAVAEATGQPYGGQEESLVGIYVTNAKPLEMKYNTNSDVYVEAKITGKALKDTINVNNICYIEGVKQGKVSPAIVSIGNNDENIIDCELGQLNAGEYTVHVRADFEYLTTSDIQYTFVSNAVTSDQYQQLGISETTIATYTGGPTELGLPALHQPLRITIGSQGNTQLSSYPFGVSLQNKWMQGKVVKGIWYSLDIPDEVSLTDCSRDYTSHTRDLQDGNTYRNIYNFSINTSNAQDAFDAVTCRMKFDNVNSLLGNDYKSIKTFAAKAKYEYAVEGTAYVSVEKFQ